jgi:hypothetical protein
MSSPLGTLLIVLLAATPAVAQTATATLSANLGGLAKLSFSSNSITFPDGDPDVLPQLDAGPLTIVAKARATQGSTVTLTVQANDDLRSGVDTIPADALSWTASGTGFGSGTISRTAPQLVASWNGSGVRAGTQTYRFRNRWTHPIGTYSVSLLYTLSSP